MAHPKELHNKSVSVQIIIFHIFALISLTQTAEVLSDPRYEPIAYSESVKLIKDDAEGSESKFGNVNVKRGAELKSVPLDNAELTDDPQFVTDKATFRTFEQDMSFKDGGDNLEDILYAREFDDVHPDDPIEDTKDLVRSKSRSIEGLIYPAPGNVLEKDEIELLRKLHSGNESYFDEDKTKSNRSTVIPDVSVINMNKTLDYKTLADILIPSINNPIKPYKTTRNGTKISHHFKFLVPVWIPSPELKKNTTAINITKALNNKMLTKTIDKFNVTKPIRTIHRTLVAEPIPQTLITKYVVQKDKNQPLNQNQEVDLEQETLIGISESNF